MLGVGVSKAAEHPAAVGAQEIQVLAGVVAKHHPHFLFMLML
jgi:hypothetical protein